MKSRPLKSRELRFLISSLFLALCIITFSLKGDWCVEALEKLAVASASTVLPTGVGVSVNQEHTNKNETSKESEPHSEEERKNSDKTEESTNLTESQKQEQDKSENETSFNATPEDVLEIMEKYKKEKGDEKKSGNITEQTYKNSGVTNSYGNVRVKNVNDTGIDIEKLLNEKADLNIKDKSKPSVLIFHTHTTETYQILDRNYYGKSYAPRSNDLSLNMVRVGVAIKEELEKAGYTVIHDTNIYDFKYNGAYDRSREAIEKHLKEYPEIQIVLDIHRDAIELNDGTKIKPICEIQGKKCAQIMIISGCQESGNGITGFDDWRYNLTFAVQLQNKLESSFPGITRPLYFCPRKYNMDTRHCSLLIEMGSDANTLEEAVYSGKCLGSALSDLMKDYTL